ncbi:ATP-binding protein [Streptomyces sp. NPDC047017]|uniref:ATP-binding protein n=1 Tax=Streptomyces sp. NPDC047017 TaxID=3155024 RepID=UPI0033FBB761
MPSVHVEEIVASVTPSPSLGTDAAAGPLAPGATTGAGPAGAVAERRFRFELAAHPGSPARARQLTRARLTGWSVCEDTCDTAALVVSELVTNAIVHTASTQVVCELHDGDDLVRISVHDEGCAPGEPRPSPQRPEEEHGRGLLLVEALCHAWGAQEQGTGLVVWADLPRTTGAEQGALGALGAQEDSETYGTPSVQEVSQTCGTPGVQEATQTCGTPGVQEVPETYGVPAAREVRGDLGWGARPKPGPARRPGHEDEPQAEQDAHGRQHARQHEPQGSGAVWL